MVFKRAREYLTMYGLLALLAVMTLGWTLMCLVLFSPLPRLRRRAAVRYTMMRGLRIYVRFLTLAGAYELDVGALDVLRGGPPLILAPNHPTSIDALLLMARHPNLACVLKPALLNNPLLGAGARLAGFIRSDPPLRMTRDAVAELERGASVLLFPEGTRTTRHPVNALTGAVAVIARHAHVPIQLALVETDSPFLGKGWPLLKAPALPIRYRVRLGSRLEAPANTAGCLERIQREYDQELKDAPQRGWIGSPRPALEGR
jgi:1-acyl-sn-glycerol-3-phosphate acyltransferase